MIIIDEHKKYHAFDKKELRNAESSLSNIVRFEIKVVTDKIVDSKMTLIPYKNYNDKYSHEVGEVDKKEIYTPNHTPYSYFVEKVTNKSILMTEDTIKINFEIIPSEYNFMDLFVFPDVISSNDLYCITLNVIQEYNEKYVFSYKRDYLNNSQNYNGIYIGTFGKVSDGWKLYPKFIPTLMGQKKILALAVGGYYDNF